MLNIIGEGEHANVVRNAAGSDWDYPGYQEIVAIGDIATRRRVVGEHNGAHWAHVSHPTSRCEHMVVTDCGTFIGAQAIVQTQARLGKHVIVGTGAIIEHDVNVHDFVNIGPGVIIGGGATIGAGTQLGLGCRIRDHITIGSDVTVGMGAVVVEDVPDGVTVMGCPARIVKRA